MTCRMLKRITLGGFVIVTLLACITRGGATTLDDYRRQVSRAEAAIKELRRVYDNENPSQDESLVVPTIARVRSELPAKENVLLGRQSVAADNTWLHEALDALEKTTNDARRAEMLARIDERLHALGERLDEMKIGKLAGSKEDEKARLAEILRRAEYNTKQAEEGNSALTRLLARFLRWLLSLFPRTKPIQPGSALALSRIAQVVVIGLSLIAIGFLIWKFAPSYLRGRRKKKVKREARIVLGERLEPDQSAADLLAQAEALARSGDVRAAIRKAYIALLCELGDRKVISLAQHKTNRDYLNAVREKASLHTAMRRLTHSFEIHWYGLYPAAESDWKDFRQVCRQALSLP